MPPTTTSAVLSRQAEKGRAVLYELLDCLPWFCERTAKIGTTVTAGTASLGADSVGGKTNQDDASALHKGV